MTEAYSSGHKIELGKTYNGATVVEIAPGADRYSTELVKYKHLPSERVHQSSPMYFVREFIETFAFLKMEGTEIMGVEEMTAMESRKRNNEYFKGRSPYQWVKAIKKEKL